MIDIKEKQETDPIENYKGKWAICYVLDNGTCAYSLPKMMKNTEQEKISDMMKHKSSSEKLNNDGCTSILDSTVCQTSVEFVCMFNNDLIKNRAKSNGRTVCISMFPIPVGE